MSKSVNFHHMKLTFFDMRLLTSFMPSRKHLTQLDLWQDSFIIVMHTIIFEKQFILLKVCIYLSSLVILKNLQKKDPPGSKHKMTNPWCFFILSQKYPLILLPYFIFSIFYFAFTSVPGSKTLPDLKKIKQWHIRTPPIYYYQQN